MVEREPPPVAARGFIGWARASLFDGLLNSLATVVAAVLIFLIAVPMIRFLLIDAVWDGASRVDCLEETLKRPVGACWPFISAKFTQLVYGFYPAEQHWRVNTTFILGTLLLLPLLVPRAPFKLANSILFFGIFPVVAFFLLVGGRFGLEHVETRSWGGLLVTMVVAVTGIVVSLPLGILLALGRRSKLPIVHTLSVVFIEFWRGVPLITILFFASYMLPLFLPGTWTLDALLRVLVGTALFASAYMAEVVRAGLQAIPRGQEEAGKAVGLGYWKITLLITLPQALRLVIPGIVNTFIGLFKDTTLVLIVAIFDFLGQIRAAFADPNWATPSTLFTGFAFAGIVYFIFCFAMSRYSMFVERRLNRTR